MTMPRTAFVAVAVAAVLVLTAATAPLGLARPVEPASIPLTDSIAPSDLASHLGVENPVLVPPDILLAPSAPFGPLPQLPPQPVEAARDWAALAAWVDRVLEDVPYQDDPFAAIDACVTEEMSRTHTPGASLAISLDGALVYTRTYGVKHKDDGGEIDPDTMFRIGSTTKQMTAAAIMQLVEQGKVDLDAPVTTYLPELQLRPPWRASDITVRHLLTHSHGLPDQYWVLEPTLSLADWFTIFNAMGLAPYVPAGTFWNYTNPGFSMAGLIVERVSGTPYGDYLAQNVWEPAGMALTTVDPAEVTDYGNFSYGHDGDARYTPADFDYPGIVPAGSAISTPTEMVRWANLLMDGGGAVLQPSSAAEMQRRQIDQGYLPYAHYGLGIMVTDFHDVSDPSHRIPVYDHGGNVPGFSSQLFWVPERGFALSLLANTMTSLTGSALCAVEALAGAEPLPYEEYRTEPDAWEPFLGTYSMLNGILWPWTARVYREGDTLQLVYTDFGEAVGAGAPITLTHAYSHTFYIDDPNLPLDFTFLPGHGETEGVRYMRSRLIVGERLGHLPERVTLTGAGCATVSFTATIDVPALNARVFGITPDLVQSDVPLGQDDPNDPSTASFKHDIEARGGLGMLFGLVTGQQDDTFATYLVYDADGDGEFAFPAEAVLAGQAAGGGAQMLVAQQPLPAGRYQLWVHGMAVEGEDSTFSLDIRLIHGDHLVLQGAPDSLAAGQAYSFQVCGGDVATRTEPGLGVIDLDYGLTPRRVRILVNWAPDATPPVFLPLGLRNLELP